MGVRIVQRSGAKLNDYTRRRRSRFDSLGRPPYYLRVMRVSSLPEWIHTDSPGSGLRSWAGGIPPEWLERMEAAGGRVLGAEGELSVDGAEQPPRIAGTVRATVEVICERCLEPLRITVEGAFDGRAVAAITPVDNAVETSAEIEAPGGRLDVRTLLEDELLLALPVVPRHDEADCDGGQRHFGPEGADMPQRPSPFAALEALRHKSGGAPD